MKTTGSIIAILMTSVLLSCSASSHAGVVTVAKPAMTEVSMERWYLYYQDQFDAHKGRVELPSEGYPRQAFEGHAKAEKEWNEKVTTVKIMNTAGGIAAILVIYTLLNFNLGPIGFSGWR